MTSFHFVPHDPCLQARDTTTETEPPTSTIQLPELVLCLWCCRVNGFIYWAALQYKQKMSDMSITCASDLTIWDGVNVRRVGSHMLHVPMLATVKEGCVEEVALSTSAKTEKPSKSLPKSSKVLRRILYTWPLFILDVASRSSHNIFHFCTHILTLLLQIF